MDRVNIEVKEDKKSVRMCVVLPERLKAKEKPVEFSKRDAFAEFNIRGHLVEDINSISGPSLVSNYRTKGQAMPALEAEFVIAKAEKKQEVKIKPAPKSSNSRKPRSKSKSVEDEPGAKSTTIED